MYKKDIQNKGDIILLVNTFYENIKLDPMLGNIFENIMHVNWGKHLPKMYDFWQNIVFHTGDYKGQPFLPHIQVNEKVRLHEIHFNRWLEIFNHTVDSLFAGIHAKDIKEKAKSIKMVWNYKIDLINQSNTSKH